MYQAQLCIADALEHSSIPVEFHTPGLDVHHYTEAVFGIDAARTFIEHIYRRPLGSPVSVHLIAPHTIPVEAQQALLKVLEEPPAHAQIYILLSDAASLLPTVRSRLLELTQTRSVPEQEAAMSFLQLSYQDRIALIADLTTKKMTKEIDELVIGLSVFAHQEVARNPHLAESVLFTEQHVHVRGASKKMLLEHIALLLPVRAT
jgi:hypothetical protein